ncbi:ent-3 [Cordylochernes scorpioides]|uniref:Ent-3 n=1 Tax=Cordylochernes scorpioides TaxID=51811 RepID=A0ABY6KHW7_9ARAC|nr:ent-3 [Cordylochernes scorpioides]
MIISNLKDEREHVLKPSPKFLWLLTTLRLAFIPLFTLCNYKPDVRKMAVIITNDWAFGGMSILLGLTNGFVATLCMVYARRRVGPEYAPMAAMLTALFLIMGMFLGANFSFFLTWLVENVSF